MNERDSKKYEISLLLCMNLAATEYADIIDWSNTSTTAPIHLKSGVFQTKTDENNVSSNQKYLYFLVKLKLKKNL